MAKQFKVDARTLIHLGRESIKDHTTALLELVKNSYDADASVVEIEIYKKSTNDLIRISDDGDGMTEHDIDSKWLRIGFSYKRSEKESVKRSRRRTGEKGIGRLSADRLGEVLEIKSKSVSEDTCGLKVNWELFDNDEQDLSSVPIDELKKPVAIQLPALRKNETGTELIISKLRNDWTVENLGNLYNELSILTSPFKEVEDFEIFIKNDITNEFNGKVLPTTILNPEVEIELNYDGKSSALSYTITDRFDPKNPVVEKSEWQNLMQRLIDPFNYPFSQVLSCGPVKIKLLLFPRTKSLAEGTNFTLTELREYIDKNVGVKIYRDNISVKPYGFPGVQYGGDWLGIAERHARNPAGLDRPEYRVLANQLVGAIFIGRDTNPDLKDSAAREGLVENSAFYDLRALTLSALALLENRRYQIYQGRKIPNNPKPTPSERSEIYKGQLQNIKNEVKTIMGGSGAQKVQPDAINKALAHMVEFIDESEKVSVSFEELLNHNRVLAGLATLGISAAVFGHETQGAITEFINAASLSQEYLEYSPEDTKIAIEELEKAIKYGKQVSAWGAFALSRVQREKRKKEQRDIHEIISKIIDELAAVFEAVDINVERKLQPVSAKVYPMDIESIVINLLTNAYTACLQTSINRVIRVSLQLQSENGKEGFQIVMSNSGPPIENNLTDWIWEPLNTLKKDVKGRVSGTGLGLTIVKSTVEALKGSKRVVTDEHLHGASFQVWLPLK